MGTSTNGQICYGILFDEDTHFPWDAEEFDGDIDNWWVYGILGFRHSFEMFTPKGNWIGGKEWPSEKIARYYNEERTFIERNPRLPVELVNCCSREYPRFIVALPGTCDAARRGYPEPFNPTDLVVSDTQKERLIKFCNDYGIEFDGEPAWYLSSFWR